MEFEVLGPIRVWSSGEAVAPSGRLQQALLGVLLARANESVPVDVLAESLWGDGRMDRAAQKLQVHVHRLRRALDEPDRLSFGPGGYRLAVAPGELDAERFEVLLTEATEYAGHDPQRSVDLIRKALNLWRGRPYGGLDVPDLARAADRLSDRRWDAVELLYESELATGRDSAIVAELTALAREQPLRERLHGLLMVALYRCGRQSDALAAYQDARRILRDELGLEPGPELQELQNKILGGEPVAVGAPATQTPAPAQLPTDVGGFVGRESELGELDAALIGDRTGTGVAVLAGTAGVGKTALAVHWAHRAREQFPDGQLYVDLRGYGPDRRLDPEQALAGFLRALGVDGASIPNELAERSARFRSLVAGRRLLVVLDNARTVDQVRPLLPGTASCVVLVTSRDALTGLGAREGAVRVALDRLSSDEADRLLTALIGDPAAASPESIGRLLDQCARLPLALRIAADLVRIRPSRGVEGLVDELTDERDRLDLLDVADDPYSAVRVVFSWSCQQLSSETLRMFQLCGLHPGASFDAYSLAALAGRPQRAARRAVDVLVRAHLVDELPGGRFQLHDLLRAYAAELVAAAESEAERTAAVDRLLDYYIATASVAVDLAGLRRSGVHPETTSDTPELGEQDGLAWLDAERANLVAAADVCGPDRVIALGHAVTSYLYLGAHLDDEVKVQTRVLVAARARGDKSTEADALRQLGVVSYNRGQYDVAADRFEQARAGYAEAGDVRGQAAAANTLGGVLWMDGKPLRARDYFEQAAALFRETGDHVSLVSPLANLAYICGRLADYEPAFAYAREAMGLADESGDQERRVHVLINLARLSERTDRLDDALAYADRVLPLVRDSGVLSFKDEALIVCGVVHRRLGDHEQAGQLLEESIEHSRTIGRYSALVEALNELGLTRRAVGDSAAAIRLHQEALDAATAAGVRYEEPRALDGLGDVQSDLGDGDDARESWQRALAIYRDLDLPEAESTQAKLDRVE